MAETKKNWTGIKCPHCGAEYIPAEIFMPGDLIGRPDSILRDPIGKILYVDYVEDEEPNASETFVCEQCGKTFIVEPVVTYKVKKQADELEFGDTSVSLID